LRAIPIHKLIEAQGLLARAEARFGDTTPPFGPVALDALADQRRFEQMVEGACTMPILMGVTHDEGHAFFPPDLTADEASVSTRLVAVTGNKDAVAQYRARRPNATLRDLLADLTTEEVFRGPTFRLIEAIASKGGRVFAYEFDWSPQDSPFKACHCIDLPFTFGNLAAWASAPMLSGGDPAAMQQISSAVRRAWTGFVRDGAPVHEAAPVWRTFADGDSSVWHIGSREPS
jgi:para-nitrobenzyl esterase